LRTEARHAGLVRHFGWGVLGVVHGERL
jgi:hypothetical protein